ncbi:potassium channel AKT1-like, partial [Trifolium medium]|nr:potassium channel AKT1-like [Trifolium medium]
LLVASHKVLAQQSRVGSGFVSVSRERSSGRTRDPKTRYIQEVSLLFRLLRCTVIWISRPAVTCRYLSGNVPLWNAMLGGHANAVQVLETNGGTLEGCPVGHYACIAASLDNMDALQALGHRDNQFLSVPNDHGRTALHVAMVRDNFPMVQYLVESGVPMDEDDNYGDSAYVLATRHGGDQIVNYLELMLLPQLI